MTTTTKKRPPPRTGSRTSPARIAAARRAARALELRAGGATFAEIARRLGYAGRTGAHDAVMRALDATVRPAADEVRLLDLVKLDKLWRTAFPRALGGDHEATRACLRIMERQARLLGLDMRQRIDANAKHRFDGVVVAQCRPDDALGRSYPDPANN